MCFSECNPFPIHINRCTTSISFNKVYNQTCTKFITYLYAFILRLKFFKCLKNVKAKLKMNSAWKKYALSTWNWKTVKYKEKSFLQREKSSIWQSWASGETALCWQFVLLIEIMWMCRVVIINYFLILTFKVTCKVQIW